MDRYNKVLANPYSKKRFNASDKFIIEKIWGEFPTFPKPHRLSLAQEPREMQGTCTPWHFRHRGHAMHLSPVVQ